MSKNVKRTTFAPMVNDGQGWVRAFKRTYGTRAEAITAGTRRATRVLVIKVRG